MKISKIIMELEKIKKEHGDLDATFEHDYKKLNHDIGSSKETLPILSIVPVLDSPMDDNGVWIGKPFMSVVITNKNYK